jgi:predicted CopG family antitoxin
MGKLTTIAVSPEVYEALRERGRTGDSFDRVLRRVLNVGATSK